MAVSSVTAALKSGVLLALLCLCSSHNIDWLQDSIFSKVPEECIPRTCSGNQTYKFKMVPPCDCDDSCSKYHKCCIDSPYASPAPAKREQCSRVLGYFNVFMVSRCNPTWRQDQITRTLCETTTTDDVRDPIAMVPVTTTFSKITYKNYFCSICNFDNRGIVLWNLKLELYPVTSIPAEKERENILRRLEYDANRNVWGIRNKTENNDEIFIPIFLSTQIPPTIASSVKHCDATEENTISVCASTWNDSAVERICRSYFSPITVQLAEGDGGVSSVHFRNPHCAVCNYMGSFEKSYCGGYGGGGGYRPGLSFTLLLDVNPSDGNNVGQSSSCSKDEMYDPFFKKCRALVCALPGYVIRNRQCVKT